MPKIQRPQSPPDASPPRPLTWASLGLASTPRPPRHSSGRRASAFAMLRPDIPATGGEGGQISFIILFVCWVCVLLFIYVSVLCFVSYLSVCMSIYLFVCLFIQSKQFFFLEGGYHFYCCERRQFLDCFYHFVCLFVCLLLLFFWGGLLFSSVTVCLSVGLSIYLFIYSIQNIAGEKLDERRNEIRCPHAVRIKHN